MALKGSWRSPNQGRKRSQDESPEDGIKRRRSEDSMCPPATLRVLVRNSDAGGIIGKGGDNIKRLRKTYDCQVLLPDSAGSPERVMTIMGTIDSCCGVVQEVLPKIGEDLHRGEPNFSTEVQILIPQPFMGTIIGTGGTKIKELRQKTKASIKIFSEPMPSSNERSISLQGTSDQIVQCVKYFLEEISKKEPREPIFLYEPGGQFNPPFDTPPAPPVPAHPSRVQMSRGPKDFPPPSSGQWGNRVGGRGGGGTSGRGRSRGGRPPPRDSYSHTGSWTPPPHSFNNSSPQPPHFSGPPPPVGYGNSPPSQVPSGGGYPPSNSGYSGSGQPSGHPSGRQTQQVTIPIEYSEAILGPGGSRIHNIRAQSGCEITLEDPKPGSVDRIITIIGTPNAIQFAQQLMQNSVRQYHNV